LILETLEVYYPKMWTTLSSVKSRLAMEDPMIVGLPPYRSNIKMIVEPCSDLSELCENLAKDLRENCIKTIKTVVFCRSLKDYGKMRMMINFWVKILPSLQTFLNRLNIS